MSLTVHNTGEIGHDNREQQQQQSTTNSKHEIEREREGAVPLQGSTHKKKVVLLCMFVYMLRERERKRDKWHFPRSGMTCRPSSILVEIKKRFVYFKCYLH